jgi:hypothetical protein
MGTIATDYVVEQLASIALFHHKKDVARIFKNLKQLYQIRMI